MLPNLPGIADVDLVPTAIQQRDTSPGGEALGARSIEQLNSGLRWRIF
jgi:hypothetical protein